MIIYRCSDKRRSYRAKFRFEGTNLSNWFASDVFIIPLCRPFQNFPCKFVTISLPFFHHYISSIFEFDFAQPFLPSSHILDASVCLSKNYNDCFTWVLSLWIMQIRLDRFCSTLSCGLSLRKGFEILKCSELIKNYGFYCWIVKIFNLLTVRLFTFLFRSLWNHIIL